MLYPVILSGGFGGRLWPVSREARPKQFISLVNHDTLLQEAVLRLRGLKKLAPPTLVCNVRHRFIAAEQLRGINSTPRRILLEPVGRNTAPAVAMAALDIAAENPEGVMLVMPSDHIILNVPSFHAAVRDGMALAQKGFMVTFGIVPTAAKTGYGYIRQGSALNNGTGLNAHGSNSFGVAAFVEKPDRLKAQAYLESREYLWNSGIFMFKASAYLAELEKHAPDIAKGSRDAFSAIRHDVDFAWLDEEIFARCPSNSLDYAVMEKTDAAAVIPVSMGWSDVGSWGALWEVVAKDSRGNVADGHVYMKDVSNCYIKSSKEIVAALGIDDLIVIDTEDALLVAHMSKEQEVRDVFKKLM